MAKIEFYKWAKADPPKRKIWFRFSNRPTMHRFRKEMNKYGNTERN